MPKTAAMSSRKSSSSLSSKKNEEETNEETNNDDETNGTDTEGTKYTGTATEETSSKRTNSRGTASRLHSRESPDDETGGALSTRFLKWTSRDLFDPNPDYAASVRGVLNIVHIIVNMLIMTLVGSACQYPQSVRVTYFYCHSSATFTFVVTCSALIQSILMLACCLLSKKADVIIFSSPLEVVNYVIWSILLCIAGLVLEANLTHAKDGYGILLAGGVFAITNSVLYFISAIWFCVYHKTRREKNQEQNKGRRYSSEIGE